MLKAMCRAIILTGVLASPAAAAGEQPAAPGEIARPTLSHTETSLGRLAVGANTQHMVFSPDGQRLAYPSRVADGWQVVLDGQPSRTYEWILPRSLVFSPDSRLAFIAQEGDAMFIVFDGRELPRYHLVSSPAFSPDSQRIAYAAQKARPTPGEPSTVLVLDGEESAPYHAINTVSLLFSADGQRFAFQAERHGRRLWVVDGQDGPLYEQVGPLVWSGNSRHWGHMAERDRRQMIVFDGRERQMYDMVGALAISEDGSRVAHAALRGTRYFIVDDGQEQQAYDRVGPPIFSPDGGKLAYEAQEGRSWMVVLDGREGRPYDGVFGRMFASDDRLVYRARLDQRQMMVIDGQEQQRHDQVGLFFVSANGRSIAYAARDGTEEYLVFNGARLEGVGQISLSPDGRHVAHSRDRMERSTLLVNGVEGPTWDGFLHGSRWVWQDNNTFTLLAAREGEIFRVEVKVAE